jgi:sugar/nucleoside kinase (ribokinase family)
MSVLVLGTVALDSVKTPFGQRRHMLGGSAVHFSMVARLFTDVNLVAVIGEDFPVRYINFLHQKGINLASLIRLPGKTFKWEGRYEGDLNSAITLNTHLGVLADFRPLVQKKQRKIEYIFLANIDPQIQDHLLSTMHAPRLVALDSMNFWIRHKRKALLRLLKKVDMYVANDQEARDLSGQTNLVKAARRLASCGPKMVLIKKGEHGVLFYSRDFIFSLPAYPTEKVIDPTGAGDTFAGGLIGYLAKAKRLDASTIKKALAYGTVAASFNIEGFGVERTARLKIADLEKRLDSFKKTIVF